MKEWPTHRTRAVPSAGRKASHGGDPVQGYRGSLAGQGERPTAEAGWGEQQAGRDQGRRKGPRPRPHLRSVPYLAGRPEERRGEEKAEGWGPLAPSGRQASTRAASLRGGGRRQKGGGQGRRPAGQGEREKGRRPESQLPELEEGDWLGEAPGGRQRPAREGQPRPEGLAQGLGAVERGVRRTQWRAEGPLPRKAQGEQGRRPKRDEPMREQPGGARGNRPAGQRPR